MGKGRSHDLTRGAGDWIDRRSAISAVDLSVRPSPSPFKYAGLVGSYWSAGGLIPIASPNCHQDKTIGERISKEYAVSISRLTSLGAVSLLAAALFAGPALADGMPDRRAATAPEERLCSLSANIGVTTDYVFRGFSQTAEGPAVQGGVDAT